MIKNQILPETAVYYRHQEEKKQKEKSFNRSGRTPRSNNRKTTRNRKLQKIKFVISLFPLVMKTRELKSNL